jgi:NTP pyrophosphatase (non-canonical NTP hydrolase)
MVRCENNSCPGYEPDFLKRLAEAIEMRSANEFKSAPWTGERWLVATTGELGELCNLVKKEWRDGGINPSDIEDETADVFIYLVAWANHRGMNLQEVITRKFNLTSDKRGYNTKL